MPGSSNFLVFNANNVENTDTDGEYLAEVQRINGLQNGIAKTAMHNKFYRQVSIMVAAIGKFMANEGQTVSDNDLESLISAIQDAFETPAGALAKVGVHASNTNNPHAVTAEQTGAIPMSKFGTPVGVATLNTSGVLDQKPYITGTYTGNGSASRLINLGFTPTAIFVIAKDGDIKAWDALNAWQVYYYGGLAIYGLPVTTGITTDDAGATVNEKVIEIATGGFNVFVTSFLRTTSRYTYIRTNESGKAYHYIAFR